MIPNIEQTETAETVRNKNILCIYKCYFMYFSLNIGRSLPFSKTQIKKKSLLDNSQSNISSLQYHRCMNCYVHILKCGY